MTIRPHIPALLSALLAMVLVGCNGGVAKVLRKPMAAIGLETKVAPTEIELRLYPADNLNSSDGHMGHATVLRVYQLKDITRFERLPYESFLDQQAVKSALGDDLSTETELVLTPGSQQTLRLSLQEPTRHIGIVALYASPAANRWRFSFNALHPDARKSGITIGVHACALTTDSSALLTQVAGNASSLLTVQCPFGRSRR